MYYILTFDINNDPLRHRRRYSVGRDAEVRPHLRAADALQAQRVAFVDCYWSKRLLCIYLRVKYTKKLYQMESIWVLVYIKKFNSFWVIVEQTSIQLKVNTQLNTYNINSRIYTLYLIVSPHLIWRIFILNLFYVYIFCGDVLHNSIRNALRIRWKVRNAGRF